MKRQKIAPAKWEGKVLSDLGKETDSPQPVYKTDCEE